jgi:outer membrane protein OmpA-like peptidoglycan-associated protein
MIVRLERKPLAPAPPRAAPARTSPSGAPAGLPRYLAGRPVAVSQPTDASERHADHLAEHVMSPTPGACPRCAASGGSCGGCGGHVARAADGSAPRGRSAARPAEAPALGGGRPLDRATRAWFEPRFGRDLDGVRVHDGAEDAALARAFAARAFTSGEDIVFGRGQYAPETDAGRRLLAHELAHVVAPAPAGRVARQPDAGVAMPGAGADAAAAPHDAAMAPPVPGGPAPADAATAPASPAGPAPMFDGAYGGCPTVAEGLRRDTFARRIFHLERNIPSTTFGMFDATWWAAAAIMPITVKIKFKFVAADTAPGFWARLRRTAAGEDLSRFYWSDTEKADFKREYIERVIHRWSARFTLSSTKPCWGFLALPLIAPAEVDDDDDAHYIATVHKSPGPAIEHGKSGVSDPDLAHPERPSRATLYQSAVREEVSYSSQAVATSERQRIETALGAAAASPVLFAKDSDVLTPAATGALGVFADALRAKNPSEPLIPLHLDGFASAEGDAAHNVDLANRRVVAVRDFLARRGVPQPVGVLGHGPVGAPNDPANRRVDITADHTFETTYASNRFSVGEHEFGHMLGLPDEYQNNTTGVLGTQQALYTGLVTAAGVAGPAVWGVRTASQMADGVDVLPRHYVTVWEALARMTSPDITQAEWRIR